MPKTRQCPDCTGSYHLRQSQFMPLNSHLDMSLSPILKLMNCASVFPHQKSLWPEVAVVSTATTYKSINLSWKCKGKKKKKKAHHWTVIHQKTQITSLPQSLGRVGFTSILQKGLGAQRLSSSSVNLKNFSKA